MLNISSIINAAIEASQEVMHAPKQETILWERKVGGHRVFFYRLQIRLLPSGKFVAGTSHNCYRDRFNACADVRETLEEAVQDAAVFVQGYCDAESEDWLEGQLAQQRMWDEESFA